VCLSGRVPALQDTAKNPAFKPQLHQKQKTKTKKNHYELRYLNKISHHPPTPRLAYPVDCAGWIIPEHTAR
jgi:hypothetical protein